MTEQILVVPTSAFHKIGLFQGFNPDWQKYYDGLLNQDMVSFKPRDQMETDPTYKQIIPYCMFVCNGNVLRYQRVKFQGQGETETRLQGKISVGIGGHVNDKDMDLTDCKYPGRYNTQLAYELAVDRELAEEVTVDSPRKHMRMVGVINDDSNDVGSVHLGFVHVVQVTVPCVYPRERGLASMFFDNPNNTLDACDLETWSQLALKHFVTHPDSFLF